MVNEGIYHCVVEYYNQKQRGCQDLHMFLCLSMIHISLHFFNPLSRRKWQYRTLLQTEDFLQCQHFVMCYSSNR